mmetsp:Transcript_10064/g.25060  ORF Transcript_10064/g.25060 Transcript_10064/m.25060 type:complete len:233 (-) Transcript_10064:107-805(-)
MGGEAHQGCHYSSGDQREDVPARPDVGVRPSQHHPHRRHAAREDTGPERLLAVGQPVAQRHVQLRQPLGRGHRRDADRQSVRAGRRRLVLHRGWCSQAGRGGATVGEAAQHRRAVRRGRRSRLLQRGLHAIARDAGGGAHHCTGRHTARHEQGRRADRGRQHDRLPHPPAADRPDAVPSADDRRLALRRPSRRGRRHRRPDGLRRHVQWMRAAPRDRRLPAGDAHRDLGARA